MKRSCCFLAMRLALLAASNTFSSQAMLSSFRVALRTRYAMTPLRPLSPCCLTLPERAPMKHRRTDAQVELSIRSRVVIQYMRAQAGAEDRIASGAGGVAGGWE